MDVSTVTDSLAADYRTLTEQGERPAHAPPAPDALQLACDGGLHRRYIRRRMATTGATFPDYAALTQGCALVDRSERGKLALTGGEAKAFLQGQVTNDVEALEPGRGCYAAFLTHKGKMLGDMRVLDVGEELLLDTERVALQELFNMIRRYKLGRDVELHKRTIECRLLRTRRFYDEADW